MSRDFSEFSRSVYDRAASRMDSAEFWQNAPAGVWTAFFNAVLDRVLTDQASEGEDAVLLGLVDEIRAFDETLETLPVEGFDDQVPPAN